MEERYLVESLLEAEEELEDMRDYGASKAENDEMIALEQALAKIEAEHQH